MRTRTKAANSASRACQVDSRNHRASSTIQAWRLRRCLGSRPLPRMSKGTARGPRAEGREHRAESPEHPRSTCENFLYGFKAARRAARAADTARSPSLPLALPLRRRQRRSTGAKIRNRGPLSTYGSYERAAPRPVGRIWQLSGAGVLPTLVCSARPEPVKSAYGVGFADLRLLTEPARQPHI